MAKKRKAKHQGRKQPIQKKESNFWMITAIIAVILLAGVTAKTFFVSNQSTAPITEIQSTTARPIAIQPATNLAPGSMKDQVRQVAANFRCACGGCGELPLDECQCDMPRGAVEEKNFIKTKLLDGYNVPQVVELVNEKYGHRDT
jgi:hypothetical protein